VKDWFSRQSGRSARSLHQEGNSYHEKDYELDVRIGSCGIGAFRRRSSKAQTVNLAIASKSFQHLIYPIALDRGYMKEEGIDLKITFIEPTPSIQALMAGSVDFTVAGTSALVVLARSNAPLKVTLAVNDRVHQWLLTRPNITSGPL